MTTYIELKCTTCGIKFERALKNHKYDSKIYGKNYHPKCSRKCADIARTKSIEVTCENCGILFVKQFTQIKKTQHNFCGCNCAAQFNNKSRKTKPKDTKIVCKYCGSDFYVACGSAKKVCDKCHANRHQRQKLNISNCLMCNTMLTSKSGRRKYCATCLRIYMHSICVAAGKKGGKSSAALQIRRSKNEIYLSELCEKEYSNVTNNDPIFVSKYGNWDADILLHDYKIAILWNGVWHYKQISKKQSLKQIQTRDKIKFDIIKSNNWTPYIIKDMGKYNKKFVEKQFEILKEYIKTLSS
jgi:hypothetical protein